MIIHHGLEKVFQYFDEIIMLNQHVIAHGSVEETFTLDHFLKHLELFFLLFSKKMT